MEYMYRQYAIGVLSDEAERPDTNRMHIRCMGPGDAPTLKPHAP